MNNSNSLYKDLNNIDWNFSSFTNEGLNSFHWYPATFISALPGSIIPILTKQDDVVLDTFCGTSVTGHESIRLGRKFIGIDNNPIAILISKAKLLFPDTNALSKIFDNFLQDPFIIRNKKNKHPNEEILKKWYHLDTFNELNSIIFFIKEIENPNLRIPAQAVFSSILKKTSSQGKHWGWVCDNVIPKENEIIYKNAIDIFIKSLKNFCFSVDETLLDIKRRNLDYRRKIIRERWDIECSDTISKMKSIEENSIDLIFTSPPYYGVADYVKAQRLSFLWFHKDIIEVEGYSYNDFEQLRKHETGARSKRYTLSSFDDYMSYMKTYIQRSHNLLKKNGHLVLIMGDSKSRNETMDIIDEYAIQFGFSHEFEFQRQIKETRRRLMAKVKNEQIKVFTKT